MLLSYLLVLGVIASAKSVIFEDSFEGYTDFAITNVGDWTLTDVDKKTTAFQGIDFPNSAVFQNHFRFLIPIQHLPHYQHQASILIGLQEQATSQ